jgi:UDP-N-acetylmuramate: L-alanyl-gamma-D-glutamyl-meso-diaminopimelate ligase
MTTGNKESNHLYFLGIGGTLMGSIAILAKEAGYEVSGNDEKLYPPMSNLLRKNNITVDEGFHPENLNPQPDQVIVGNANLPRGHPALEYVLNRQIPYTSGAEWLGINILRNRWVIAVSGTHGKTTTSSMIAWILEYAGLNPGYLIGGLPTNFDHSARMGSAPFFVVEADEYDTSFFDRRSKFVHYRPRTLVINNLEFDHADIFENIGAIEDQFHLLIRSIPSEGLIIAPKESDSVNRVLERGCWTPINQIGQAADRIDGELWSFSNTNKEGNAFDVLLNGRSIGRIHWKLIGEHNMENALGAIAAARHAGVSAEIALAALNEFKGVKRRMEVIIERPNFTCYDDFAHHPTAIRKTLKALRDSVGKEKIIAIIEPGTHTMSLGTLREELDHCTDQADESIWFKSDKVRWDVHELIENSSIPSSVQTSIEPIINYVMELSHMAEPCHVVIMSNGGFQGIYEKLQKRFA